MGRIAGLCTDLEAMPVEDSMVRSQA